MAADESARAQELRREGPSGGGEASEKLRREGPSGGGEASEELRREGPSGGGEASQELAALAHLELSAAEAAMFGAQLEKILGYVRGLQAVDVEGVPEWLTAEHPCSGLRGDVAGPDFDADRALTGAPALRDRLIAVPKFLHTRLG